MTYLFIDINISLYYKFFVEIPWSELFGNPYKIVLAPVVVDELDKNKRHPNSKISSRARKVLKRFEEVVKLPTSFSLQYVTQRPLVETFQKHLLDRQQQDDSILASIIEFKKDHQNDEIIFVANAILDQGLGRHRSTQ